MKKFWKYFTLTILFLLGLCCVGLLYLFFVPNSSLFGIRYISYNHNVNSLAYSIENVETISLNSNAYKVKLVSSEENKISVKLYTNSLGFVLNKNKDALITSSLKDNILTFNITEPTGALFHNSSYIELTIPKSESVNLNIKNNKADLTLDNNNIHINNLTYTTDSGDFILKQASISGTLNLNLNRATFTVEKTVITNSNDVVLNMTSGKFDAEHSSFKNITIESNTRGIVIAKSCENITQETTSAGGRISINTAGFVSVNSSSTNVYIDTITNGANINLTGTGDIKITNLTESSYLSTNSGNINIINANSHITIKTNSGNITIPNAKSTLDVQTEYGTINISYSDTATNRSLSAILNDGKIIASGLEKINLVINGNGRAPIDMKDVIGSSSVVGNTGSVFIKVNKNSVYKLKTESEGSVKVNLAQISQYGGYTTGILTTTYVNCDSSDYKNNTLEVSTKTGNLTILDSNFA